MQAQDAHGFSLAIVVAFCAAAWLSGAIFGWGLRETVAFLVPRPRRAQPRGPQALVLSTSPRLAEAPASSTSFPVEAPPRRRRTATRRQRRGGGYYFSEEARGWGDGRWRRRTGWVTAGVIVVLLGGSAIVAVSNYKPTRLPPAGVRH